MTDVSAGIASFNTAALLLRCVESVLTQEGAGSLHVVVTDNASSDASVAQLRSRFPQVKIIQNSTNRFFSEANNQAYAAVDSRYALIFNSDAELQPGTLAVLVRHLDEHPKCAAVGCRMYHADGRLQHNGSRDYSYGLAWLTMTFLGKLFKRQLNTLQQYTMYADWDRESSRTVDVLPDSCLLLRRSALASDELPYDPRMLMYFTENDLCLRLRSRGWSVNYIADGAVVHPEKQSVKKSDPALISRIHRHDTYIYYLKHEGWLKAFALHLGITLTWLTIQMLHRSGLRKFKSDPFWGIG